MEQDDLNDDNDYDELFTNAKGHPIEFSLSLSCAERNKAQHIVENFGGRLVGSSRGANTICLVVPGILLNDRNEDLFKLQYIYDCVQQRELLDIKNYRANESQYTSDVDVMDIVLGIKSWYDAKKKNNESGEIVSDFEDDDEPVAATEKISKMRREYTFAEKKAIIEYIVKHKRFSEVKGKSVWVDMEKAKVCPHRSWESMKEHFRKVIVHRINEFDLDVSTAKKLCRLYLTPDVMKMRFGDPSSKEREEQARAPDLQCTGVGSIEEDDENSSNEMRCKRKTTDDIDHTEPVKQTKLHDLGRVNATNHSVNEATSDSTSNTNTGYLYQINEIQPVSSPDRSVALRDIPSDNEDDTTNRTTLLQLNETQPFSCHLSPNPSEASEEDNGELSPVTNIPLQDRFIFQKEVVTQDNYNSGEHLPAESIVVMDGMTNGKDIPAEVSISIEDQCSDHHFIRESMSETLPSAAPFQDIQKMPPDSSSNTKEDRNNAITSSVESNNSHSSTSQIGSRTAQSYTVQNSDIEEDSNQQREEMLLPLGIPVNIKEEVSDVSDCDTVIFSSEQDFGVYQERSRQNVSNSGDELFSSDQEICACSNSALNERKNVCHEMHNLPQKSGYKEGKGSCTKNSFKSEFQCRKSGIEYKSDGSVSSDEVVIRRPRINRKLHTIQRKSKAKCKTKKLIVLLKRLDPKRYEKINRDGSYSYIIDGSYDSEPDSLKINTENKVNYFDRDEDVVQKMLPKKTRHKFPNSTHRGRMAVNNSSDTEYSDNSSLGDNDDAFEVPESDSSVHICEDSDYTKGNSKIRQPRFYRVYEDVAILNYIHKTKSHSRVGGVQLWKEMENSGVIKDRSWHSLKERFRKVLVKNLRKYAKSGVDKAVITKFEKSINVTGPKNVGDVQKTNYIRTYTREEDLRIIDFIRRTKRYHGVAGKVLWEFMSSADPGLRGRTWQSLKERYRKIIVKNLEKYGIPEKEKIKFEETVRTRKEKCCIHRCPPKGCIRKHYTRKKVRSSVDSRTSEDESCEDSNDAHEVQHRKARGGRIKKPNIITDESKPSITFQRKKKKLYTLNEIFCDTPAGVVPNRRSSRRVKNVTTAEKNVDHPHMADISSNVVAKHLSFMATPDDSTIMQEKCEKDELPTYSSHISTSIPHPEGTDHPQSRSDSTYYMLEKPAETECAEVQELAAISSDVILENKSLEGNQNENVEERPGTGMETDEIDILVEDKMYEDRAESLIPESEREDRHNLSEVEGKGESRLNYKSREEHSGNPSEQKKKESRGNCSQQGEKDESSMNHRGTEGHSGNTSEQEEDDSRHNCSQQKEKDESSVIHEGREEYSNIPPENVDITSESETEETTLPASSDNLDSEDSRGISHNVCKVGKFKDCKKNKIPSKGTSGGTASISRHNSFKSPRFSNRECIRKLRSVIARQTMRKRKIRKVELKGTGKIK